MATANITTHAAQQLAEIQAFLIEMGNDHLECLTDCPDEAEAVRAHYQRWIDTLEALAERPAEVATV